MATRASIAVFDGSKYHAIYHHWDGYLEGLGKVLLKRYDTLEKVMAIIARGHASTILDEGEEAFYSERSKWDEGSEDETDMEASIGDSYQEVLRDVGLYAYNYLFENGRWYVYMTGKQKSCLLADVLRGIN